jgi:hypothetical protein
MTASWAARRASRGQGCLLKVEALRSGNGRLRRNLAVHQAVGEGRVAAPLRTSMIRALQPTLRQAAWRSNLEEATVTTVAGFRPGSRSSWRDAGFRPNQEKFPRPTSGAAVAGGIASRGDEVPARPHRGGRGAPNLAHTVHRRRWLTITHCSGESRRMTPLMENGAEVSG